MSTTAPPTNAKVVGGRPPPQQTPQTPDPATVAVLALIAAGTVTPPATLAAALGVPAAVLATAWRLAPPFGPLPQTGTGQRHAHAQNVALRARYVIAAARRLSRGGTVQEEQRWLRAHLAASNARVAAARAADSLAARHGPILRWRTKGDERVTAGCRAMDGRLFDVRYPPLVEGRPSFPGGTHAACRCVAEPPNPQVGSPA